MEYLLDNTFKKNANIPKSVIYSLKHCTLHRIFFTNVSIGIKKWVLHELIIEFLSI